MRGVIKPDEVYNLEFLAEFFNPNARDGVQWVRENLINSGFVTFQETRNNITVKGSDLIEALSRNCVPRDPERFEAYLKKLSDEKERKRSSRKTDST